MDSGSFLKQFLGIYGNTNLEHQTDDSYNHMDFSVTITPEHSGKNRIVIFSGDHGIFPIMFEVPNNSHHLELGYIDIFIVENKQLKRSKKQRSLLKLMVQYLEENNLIKKISNSVD